MFDEKTVAILKVRAKIIDAARCWLNQNGYIEVQGPVIIPAVGDLPSSFEVKYFDKKAYLSQGLQPYANAFVANLGKIFTIAPAFRAEKLRNRRHLTEYWRIQVAQQGGFDSIISVQEGLIAHICGTLSAEIAEVLKCLNRSADDLERVQAPFPKLTYDDAIDLLQKDGFKIWWGQTIDWEMERNLSLRFNQPFLITKFPVGAETFFYKSDPEQPELTLSVDMLAPEGFGELGSGAQMITEKGVMSEKMIEENIAPDDQLWYLNFMCANSLSQSGFALGLERLVRWVCHLADIREAVAFPRTYQDLFP